MATGSLCFRRSQSTDIKMTGGLGFEREGRQRHRNAVVQKQEAKGKGEEEGGFARRTMRTASQRQPAGASPAAPRPVTSSRLLRSGKKKPKARPKIVTPPRPRNQSRAARGNTTDNKTATTTNSGTCHHPGSVPKH